MMARKEKDAVHQEREKKEQALLRYKSIKTKKARKDEERARREEEERQRAVWISSTQMCIPIRDVIRSIVVTDDRRYIKLIEVVPQNFDMLSVKKQNEVRASFAGLLSIIPATIQIKCLSRNADVNEQVSAARKQMSEKDNPVIKEMQEDYLKTAVDHALSAGTKRRFIIAIEHQDNQRADGTGFEAIVANLEFMAKTIKTKLLDCGNQVMDTGDSTAGTISLLYEILSRARAEKVPFEKHSTEIFNRYRSQEKKIEKPTSATANEFIAPQYLDFQHSRYCVADGKFYTFSYITSDGYPDNVITGWLSFLVNCAAGIDVDIYIKSIPRDKIQEAIGRNQRFAKTKRVNETNTDYFATADTLASGWYLLRGLAGGQSYFRVSIMITITADSLESLNFRANAIEKSARSNGIKMRRCGYLIERAFYSSLPICKLDKTIERQSWRNMLTDGASSLYPFLSFEMNDPSGIIVGRNATNGSMISIDRFDTSRHVNANMVIAGMSGYGKTFTSQLFAIRERLQGTQVFILTPSKGKEDYGRIVDRIQGQFLTMGPGTPYSINVFDIIPPDTSIELDGQTVQKSFLTQKIQSLHTFFRLIIKDITYEEEQLLDGAIYAVYAQRGITDDNASLYNEDGTLKEFPLMEELYAMLMNDAQLHRLGNIIRPYVNGSHSEFNRRTNVNLSNKYIVFDFDGLSGYELASALFVCLDFVWMKIKENKAVKKSVYIDEIWRMISVDGNDIAGQYCLEIFKTIRAYGGSAIAMTQEISDFFQLKGGQYGKGIISNADTKVILRLNPNEVEQLRKVIEISEREASHIIKYPRGSGLLMVGAAHVPVEFHASDKETFVISTDPEIARRDHEERQKRLEALKKLKKTNSEENSADGTIQNDVESQ